MKFVRFQIDQKIFYGELSSDSSELRVLAGDIFTDYTFSDLVYRLEDVSILPPVSPEKVVCIGMNYEKHIAEKGREIPDEPVIFMVSSTALISHEAEIQLPNDHLTEFEAELIVIMKRECRGVSEDQARDYVLGYTIGNDISDRVLQQKDKQFTRAKSFHTFKPLGPSIATDLDPNNLDIELKQNGKTRQKSNTREMIFSVERLISDISMVMTLFPGDVIFTGTPEGVAPIGDGDNLEVSIKDIGTLRNSVVTTVENSNSKHPESQTVREG